MGEVVQEAFNKAGDSRRWQHAIVRAKIELGCNPFIHRNGQALVLEAP